jgi:hypothetical protein
MRPGFPIEGEVTLRKAGGQWRTKAAGSFARLKETILLGRARRPAIYRERPVIS